ncbi:triadin-like isoform X40 [Oncorhynchus keta]|uniref:triadin-like isoform X40 n=1 Tax=Oncorhynchus keta TaxID=8018 RepID=UPI0015FD8024|nr:triadin-like isoform X40 [Oncorhynchus keta]
MTEGVEARSSTTTMVIESKNGEAGQPLVRVSKRTVTDDLYTTFSSPMAWILVLALVITWSCVAIIMFDLMDYKGITGVPPPPAVRKAIKEAGRSRGSIQHISSDPMKVVNEAVEESTGWGNLLLTFASNLVAPEEEEEIEGELHPVKKKVKPPPKDIGWYVEEDYHAESEKGGTEGTMAMLSRFIVTPPVEETITPLSEEAKETEVEEKTEEIQAVSIFTEIIPPEAPEEEEEETEEPSAEPELTIEEALEEEVVGDETAEPESKEEVEPITDTKEEEEEVAPEHELEEVVVAALPEAEEEDEVAPEPEEEVEPAVKEVKVQQAATPAHQVVCPCMHSSKPKEPEIEPAEEKAKHVKRKVAKQAKKATPDRKKAPKKEPVVRTKRERDMCKPVENTKRREVARQLELEEAIRKRELRLKKEEKEKSTKKDSQHVDAGLPAPAPVPTCQPTPVYWPSSPPGWYLHHIFTDNPFPPTTMTAHPTRSFYQAPPAYQVYQAEPAPAPATQPAEPAPAPATQPAEPTHAPATQPAEPAPAPAEPATQPTEPAPAPGLAPTTQPASWTQEPQAPKEKQKAGTIKKVPKEKTKAAAPKKEPVPPKEKVKKQDTVVSKEKVKPAVVKKEAVVSKEKTKHTTMKKEPVPPKEKVNKQAAVVSKEKVKPAVVKKEDVVSKEKTKPTTMKKEVVVSKDKAKTTAAKKEPVEKDKITPTKKEPAISKEKVKTNTTKTTTSTSKKERRAAKANAEWSLVKNVVSEPEPLKEKATPRVPTMRKGNHTNVVVPMVKAMARVVAIRPIPTTKEPVEKGKITPTEKEPAISKEKAKTSTTKTTTSTSKKEDVVSKEKTKPITMKKEVVVSKDKAKTTAAKKEPVEKAKITPMKKEPAISKEKVKTSTTKTTTSTSKKVVSEPEPLKEKATPRVPTMRKGNHTNVVVPMVKAMARVVAIRPIPTTKVTEEKLSKEPETAKEKPKASEKKETFNISSNQSVKSEDKVKDVKTSDAKAKTTLSVKTAQPTQLHKAEKTEKKAVKEAKEKEVKPPGIAKESQTDDNAMDKKKPGQKVLQCVLMVGKNAHYPLRPSTPGMTPVSMSPAMRSMMLQQAQQQKARAAGQ